MLNKKGIFICYWNKIIVINETNSFKDFFGDLL